MLTLGLDDTDIDTDSFPKLWVDNIKGDSGENKLNYKELKNGLFSRASDRYSVTRISI